MTMLLYHFTQPANLQAIAKNGLRPGMPDPGWLTLGNPVVWLTAAATMQVTDENIKCVQKLSGQLRLSEAETVNYAKALVGGEARLAVRLEPIKKLVRYKTWLREQDWSGKAVSYDDLMALMTPSAQTNWWVYFGQIKPDQIVAGLERKVR